MPSLPPIVNEDSMKRPTAELVGLTWSKDDDMFDPASDAASERSYTLCTHACRLWCIV